jgi:hypothetical protein
LKELAQLLDLSLVVDWNPDWQRRFPRHVVPSEREVGVKCSEDVGILLDEISNSSKGEVERLKRVDAVRVVDRVVGQTYHLKRAPEITPSDRIGFGRSYSQANDAVSWSTEAKFTISDRSEWLLVQDFDSKKSALTLVVLARPTYRC